MGFREKKNVRERVGKKMTISQGGESKHPGDHPLEEEGIKSN